MKKLLINSLQQSFQKCSSRILNNLSRIGTHVHIGLTAVIFIMFLLTNRNTQQVSQNTSRIDSVAKDDSASKREIDSVHLQVAEHQKIIAANDEKFSEILKELERMKLDQQKFNDRIDKASAQELAAFYRTKKMPAR